jgi:hypothetical protein
LPEPGEEGLDVSKYDTFTKTGSALYSQTEYAYSGSVYDMQGGVSNLYSLPEELQANNSGRVSDHTKDPNIIDYVQKDLVRPSDPTKKYYGFDVEARRNELERWFFTADFDFLYKSAEEYAKIENYQDYNIDPTDSYDFVWSALEFLDGGRRSDQEYTKLAADLKGVAREIAERMKNGESTDLESLTSTVTIKGAQFTMSELKGLQEDAMFFASFSPEIGEQQSSYANLGLANVAGKMIADKYAGKSEEFASALKSAFSRTVDEFSAKLQKRYEKVNPVDGRYYIAAAKAGLETERLFNGVDTSSKEAAQKSYKDVRAQLSEHLNRYVPTSNGFSASAGATLSHADRQFQKILDYVYS